MTPSLNLSQKNALTTVLRIFEESLLEVSQSFNNNQTEGIMFQRNLCLSSDKIQRTKGKIQTALDQISNLKEAFGLEEETIDLERLINAKMIVSWANLIDTKSDKLTRFGDVDPVLTEDLDPFLNRLAELALEIASLVHEKE